MMAKKRGKREGGAFPGAGGAVGFGGGMDWDADRHSRSRRSEKFDRGLHKKSRAPEDGVSAWSAGADYEEDDSGQSMRSFAVNSLMEGEAIMEQAAKDDCWGLASAIDIYECDPGLIRDAEAIRRFVAELCELIEMKRFGETQVVHFGEDERVAGFSMVQLIETSLISAHFANDSNATYLDVFSCKPYNPQLVRQFAQNFFKGKTSNLQVSLRR